VIEFQFVGCSAKVLKSFIAPLSIFTLHLRHSLFMAGKEGDGSSQESKRGFLFEVQVI
jgi:hypothetical protein